MSAYILHHAGNDNDHHLDHPRIRLDVRDLDHDRGPDGNRNPRDHHHDASWRRNVTADRSQVFEREGTRVCVSLFYSTVAWAASGSSAS